MTADFTVRGIDGRTFNIRIVREGDGYGRNNPEWAVTHDEAEPLVEFYDASQNPEVFGELGQFVNRYYITTLLEGENRGLALEGSVREWTIAAPELGELRAALREEIAS